LHAGGARSVALDWLGDTDDAVRLVGVRELIGGAPWFDTTLPRIGAPTPLLSHWSRLIDAPLAALIGIFTPLLGPERAELATRIVWPALLFLALALIVAREAQRRAGPVGAAFAVMLVATSVVALAQFRPGRVDHHNAQILCAVAALLFLRAAWTTSAPDGSPAVCSGWGSPSATRRSRWWCRRWGSPRWWRCGSRGTARARVALAATASHARNGAAATLLVALIATIPPSRWLDDALRCAVSQSRAARRLWCSGPVDGYGRAQPALHRVGLLGVAWPPAPASIRGWSPPAWPGRSGRQARRSRRLARPVMEAKSILWLGTSHPGPALAAVGFMMAGVVAQLALWRRQRDTRSGLAAAFVMLAAALDAGRSN
jgi:hypothetical protein